eukprot:scaffold5146_cov164-Ochromonas_danica.AAC.2
MSGRKDSSNVSVAVRIRPRNEKEITADMPVYFSPSSDGSTVQELDENGVVLKNWAYDNVFGPDCNNRDIFETSISKLVDAALEGKTFTLFGGGSTVGVVQLAMEHVQNRITQSQDAEYVIRLTYTELYNEEIKDLLSATHNENLKIIDDPQLGPLIQNITEANFTTASEMKQLLEEGSERASKSGTTGQSLKEGSYINRSLLTLGTVISNLSEGKLQHIPYRNSKLTRLLATALGGNAKTCVICCISPASGNLAESLNTLRFASRAKRIINHVQKNEIMDVKSLSSKLSSQAAEIDQLKQMLEMSRQLGFSPDDEEQAETLRDQAVVASKSWRNLRFVVKSGPLILNSLRAEGLTQLAKKVGGDIREAISGSKDVNNVVDDFSAIVTTYLPRNRRLLQKVNNLSMLNESDTLLGKTDIAQASDSDESEGENAIDMLNFGGDEMRELLEQAQMVSEDILVGAVSRIEALEEELNAAYSRERVICKSLEESTRIQQDQLEMIRVLKSNEVGLYKQIEELKEQWKADVELSNDNMLQLTTKIGTLEMQLADHADTIGAKSYDLLVKENDLDKLRGQVDQLTKDLNTALASKKSLEEETARTRNDLRLQMDRLRNNMHEMLMQGGEEAKVLQSQNVELTQQLDMTKDALNEANKMKAHMNTEFSRIRSELTLAVNEEKLRQDEISVLKDEMRELRLEITQLTSASSFAESQIQKLQNELQLEMKAREEAVETKETELQAIRERMRSRVNELQAEIQGKELELKSALDEVQAKQNHFQKIEQSLSLDLTRAENKLNNQIKKNEELKKENSRIAISIHAMQFKHQEEVKALKAKISELQSSLDSIGNYLKKQQEELLDNNHENDHGPYLDDFDMYYFDSPMSRAGLMKMRRVGSEADLDAGTYGSFLRRESDIFQKSLTSRSGSNTNLLASAHLNAYLRPTATSGDVEFDYPFVEDISISSEKKSRPSKLQVRVATSPHYIDEGSSSSIGEDTDLLAEMVQDQYQQVTEYSAQLLYGLNVATTLMEFSLKEGQLIRLVAAEERQSLWDQKRQDELLIGKFHDNEEFLMESRDQLKTSLEHAEQRINILENRCSQLECEFQTLQKEFFRVSKAEKVSSSQAHRFEQLQLDYKAQLDKVKLDLLRQQQDNSELKLKNLQLTGRLDEAGEKHHVLEERLDILRQEVDILTGEKENLMRQVINISKIRSSG